MKFIIWNQSDKPVNGVEIKYFLKTSFIYLYLLMFSGPTNVEDMNALLIKDAGMLN